MAAASGASMDSLMDTLTNVVGILIIVLIMVQISVSQAMKKIVSSLPAVSVEEAQQIQQESQQVMEEHKKLQEQVAQVRPEQERTQEKLKQVKPELEALEMTAKQTALPLLDVESLQKQLDDKKKTLAERKTAMDALLAEQQRLKGLLETTPVVTPPAAKVVRIPNSRPIPEKAKLERYFITGGQLYYVDMENAMKLVQTELNAAKSRLERERTKAADGSRKTIYDQEKVVKHFEQRRLALRNLDIVVPANKTSTRLVAQLVPRPGQGEPLAAAAQMTSRFQTDLRRYRNTNTVVWFHVARDSFETYLRAREITDALGIPAGWEAVNTPAYAEPIPDLEVNRLEEPKPVDPNALRIDAPKKKLD